MSRNLMPKSGAMAPYVVVNRDAAVAGVFSVDGEAGAVDLTKKYVLITSYNQRVGSLEVKVATIEGNIENINLSISSINTAIAANTASIKTKADKTSVDTSINEINKNIEDINTSLGTTLKIGQNLADVSDKSIARTNLNVDRLDQALVDSTILKSGNSNVRFIIHDNGNWGLFNATENKWKPLGIAQGGHAGVLGSGGTQTILLSPNKDKYLFVNDSGSWGCYSNTPGVGATPLSVANGGTGASTVEDARNNLQLGRAAYVQFAYVTCETTSYPGITMRNLRRNGSSDAGARLQLEIPDGVNSRPYLNQVPLSGSTGSIINQLPSTAGVLAVQGTSGREYKKDIDLADPNEALSRILDLELVNFVYKDDDQQRVRFGVIAEDAEKIAPQYIKHNQFPIPGTEVFDDEGNKISEEYQDRPSIDVNPIVMDLLGCVQAQQKHIDELKELVKQLLTK